MKKIVALVLACLFVSAPVFAEGYQVNSQSAKQAAMGHVGTAMKLGAESMHFNPAGLGFMDKTIDLSAGLFGVFTNVEYSKDNYSLKADNKVSTPMYFYGGFNIYDFLAAGVSVTTPYGSSMEWGKNWPGASFIQDISLQSFSIQPTLSWRITDRLSVGAGAMIMFGDFSLSRALIGPGAMEPLRPMGAMVPGLNDFLDKYKDTPAASATLSGDAGVRVGFNVGAMFDITEKWTVGVSYRSKVKMRVAEGTAEMQYANKAELDGMLAVVNPILEGMPGGKPIQYPSLDVGTFEAELPLPSNFNIGLTYTPTDRLLLSGEVQFVGWSAYNVLNVDFPQVGLAGYSISAAKEYKNTRIYRLGAQYGLTDRFDLRLGAYFDETPVKEDYLNPETPSMNKLGLTTGFSFRPLNNWSIDLALSYITGFGRDGSYTDALTGAKFEGHYDVSAFTPSIGLSYSF